VNVSIIRKALGQAYFNYGRNDENEPVRAGTKRIGA